MKSFLSLSLTLSLATFSQASVCNGSFSVFPYSEKTLWTDYYHTCKEGEYGVGYTFDCITGVEGYCEDGGQQWGTIWDHNCNIQAINLDGLCGNYDSGWVGVGCDNNGEPVLLDRQPGQEGFCYQASGDCGESAFTGTHLWACCFI